MQKPSKKRIINIDISGDLMSVYCMSYDYTILDSDIKIRSNEIIISDNTTVDDIVDSLAVKKITYGINRGNIEKLLNNKDEERYLVAEGKAIIETINDRFEIVERDKKELDEDSLKNIDYRNLNKINIVKPGDIIAKIIRGMVGQNGYDVFGKEKPCKEYKELRLNIGMGAMLKSNNIVATINGMPYIKGKDISVKYMYTVNDVNLSTGNIDFVGNVYVKGSVREGMSVTTGNNIIIKGNVENAQIRLRGNCQIDGNITSSTIYAGGVNVQDKTFLDKLMEVKQFILNLKSDIARLKGTSVKAASIDDYYLIKLLLENKYTNFEVLFKDICILNDRKYGNYNKLIELIEDNIIDETSSQRIKSVSELDIIIKEIENIKKEVENNKLIQSIVQIKYVQLSEIHCTGDIIINGKGCYTSTIEANGKVIFLNSDSVFIGGRIEASNEIRCQTVGSPGRGRNTLELKKKGKIYAKNLYGNTMIIINEKHLLIEKDLRNVEISLGKDQNILVEGLKMN